MTQISWDTDTFPKTMCFMLLLFLWFVVVAVSWGKAFKPCKVETKLCFRIDDFTKPPKKLLQKTLKYENSQTSVGNINFPFQLILMGTRNQNYHNNLVMSLYNLYLSEIAVHLKPVESCPFRSKKF